MKAYFEKGLLARRLAENRFELSFLNIRSFSTDKHKRVDDYPFGGKQGMLMRADVLAAAIESIEGYQNHRLLYCCPKGQRFSQKRAEALSAEAGIVFIVGYYEGVDERIFSRFPIEKVSIGDFVLTSGELPALMMADAILRLLPGVLGNDACPVEDSFSSGLLEHAQYTQPVQWNNIEVPDILRSGHHQQIADWKRKESLRETLFNRPDVLAKASLTPKEQTFIVDILKEKNHESDHFRI